jgi:RNA polymerase sigma-70 factor, ECF subfamily
LTELNKKDITVPDSELIKNLQSGDESSYRYLVDRYQVNVIRTCKGFIHSTADAQDVAQDVFIEVFESAMKFRGDSEFSTWIYRIAVNKSLNFVRSTRRKKILSLFDTFLSAENGNLTEPMSGADMSPDRSIITMEQSGAINSAIGSLPVKQRTAFILSKYDDLSYKEIAEVMNTSISSVESLIFRAKSNLQKKLFGFYKNNL